VSVRIAWLAAGALAVSACASQSPSRGVTAVVQDEDARAAAVAAAQAGEGSKAAVEAGAAAAERTRDVSEPPT
jgi:hypothetical protein